jgi:TPR repeat protein
MSYFNGQGVVRDFVRAHMWLHLAAVSGDKEAARGEALVAREMTPAQIEAAQRLASEWQARKARPHP